MSKEDLAEILNGRQYGEEVTPQILTAARGGKMVIAFGSSDDILSFEGAMTDEAGAWRGTKVYITKSARIKHRAKITRTGVRAIWDPEDLPDASWKIECDEPHATFDIFVGKQLFCRGIVFDLPT